MKSASLALICSTEPAKPIIVENEKSSPALISALNGVNPQGTLLAKHCFFANTLSIPPSTKLTGFIRDKS